MGKDFLLEKMKENYILEPNRDYINSIKDTSPELLVTTLPNTVTALIGMRNYVRELPVSNRKSYTYEYRIISDVLRKVWALS